MIDNKRLCHGQSNSLINCSTDSNPGRIFRWYWKLRITSCRAAWQFKTKGLVKIIGLSVRRFLRLVGLVKNARPHHGGDTSRSNYVEVLNLKPGELVEVKSEKEIWATLNRRRRNKGLYWMREMPKFCGKRFRVYKRLNVIILEDSGEVRKLKNTVLLEGVMCDGSEHYGCDRSCFHFWREAWLRRVD